MECSHLIRVRSSSYDTPLFHVGASEANGVEMLQIVFLSPDRFTGVHRVEIIIQRNEEDSVKDWLKRHMPTFWKLE